MKRVVVYFEIQHKYQMRRGSEISIYWCYEYSVSKDSQSFTK